jgi:putative DNA primase/helicase
MDRVELERVKRVADALARELVTPAAPDGVLLLSANEMKPEPIRWLWYGWLAQGKLHILAGAPGQGKTTIVLAFASTVSVGGRWPDGTRCPAGNVLIWSGEDDPQDTLLPRLLAMGANAQRIHFITGARVNGEVLPFDPARDIGRLAAEAQRIGDVRMLMVDPVVSAVAGDSHKNTEVRRALQPIVDLAAALDCAAVGISHFGKNGAGRDPTERVLGSVAFGAVARVVMAAAKLNSEGDDDRRVLARAKSNIGPDGGGFTYRITQKELAGYPGIQASKIDWGEAVEGAARDLLADAEQDRGDDDAGDAARFLRGLLGDGPVAAKVVFSEASGAGYSRDQMQRAARKLGVERRKIGMSGGWFWVAPGREGGVEDSEGGTHAGLPSSPPSAPPSVPHADESEVF